MLTLSNLACGFYGIVACFSGRLDHAVYAMLLAGVFDFFDGFVARLLKVSSPIGKDLDSLADMVTFGLLPGIMLFHLVQNSFAQGHNNWAYVAVLVPLLSAVRLAIFNNDTRQSELFIGVPTPAFALVVACVTMTSLVPAQNAYTHLLQNKWFYIALALVFPWLLVSNIPLIALKFKSFEFAHNKYRYALLSVSAILLLLLGYGAAPIVLMCYVILSLWANNFSFVAKT